LLADSEQFGLDCVKNGITDFRLFLKMLSENDEVIQLEDSLNSEKFKIISKNNKEREQERIRTQQIFILVHPTARLRPVPYTQ